MTTEEIKKSLEDKFAQVQQDLHDAQERNASKDELLKLHDAIEAQGTMLQDFIDAQNKNVKKTIMEQFGSFLETNKDKIAEFYKNGSGSITFKAVGPVTTGSGGDAETPPPNHNTSLGHFNLRNDEALLGMASTTSTSSASLVYTELEPKEGGYEFVAEGAVKPQTDFKWSNRYVTPKKAAAYVILTEEAVTDIARMESVAREHLTKQHGLHKANAVYFGDGTGENPTGATVYGRAFVAGAMALQVESTNFMDVVNACITDIYTTHNYTDEASYMANVCLINPVDFYLQLVSAKDGNGLPLYPQAGLFNQVTIGGVTIKPWEKIPAGKIFVADMKRYNVVNYVPFSIRIGWINDQFITNQFTMLGESRYYTYVQRLDQQAFIYDDIATIKTAITKV